MNLSNILSADRSRVAKRKVLSVAGSGIAIVSIAVVTWLAIQALQSGISLASVRWIPFTSSVVLQFAVLILLPLIWARLLSHLRGIGPNELDRSSKLVLFKAFSRSWLARYIPGRVWSFGGRLLFAAECGVSAGHVARSMVLEVVFIYGVLIVLGGSLVLAAQFHYALGALTLIMGLVALVAGAVLTQKIPGFPRLLTHNNGLLRRTADFVHKIVIGDTPLSVKHTVWGVGAYGIYSCSQLIIIVLLAASFTDLTLNQALTLAGAWGLGSALGYLSFIAPGPGGMGIREGITLVLFAQVIDLPTAGLIVAVSRIVTMMTDIAFVSLVELLNIGQKFARRIGKVSIEVNAG